MGSGAAVTFQDVCFDYTGREILHRLDFELGAGEVVGLLGPNGAGKTTTIRIICGILTAQSGSARVLGHAMPQQAMETKRRIGYVPEAAVLFESLTGQEYLELCGRLHEVPEEKLQARISQFLRAFDLAAEAEGRLETFSKGMRQKILIAAALVHNPDLVLLDEPLSGLDVHAALLVKDLIAGLAAQGKTVLYSSHVLDVVEKICDRVLIIHEGNLIANGTPEELRAGREDVSLEEVFRQMTTAPGAVSPAGAILEALRS